MGIVSCSCANGCWSRRTWNASSASRTGRLSISDPIGTGSGLSPVQLVDLLPNKGRVFVDLLMHPLMHACCGGLFDGVACNLTTQTRIMVRKGDTRRNTNRSTPFIPELRRGWAPWRGATDRPVGACL